MINVLKRFANFVRGLGRMASFFSPAFLWLAFAFRAGEWDPAFIFKLPCPDLFMRLGAILGALLYVRFAPVVFFSSCSGQSSFSPEACMREISELFQETVRGIIDREIADKINCYPDELQQAVGLAYEEVAWNLLERQEEFQQAVRAFMADSMVPLNCSKTSAAFASVVQAVTRRVVASQAFTHAINGPVYQETKTLLEEFSRATSEWDESYATARLAELLEDAERRLPKGTEVPTAPWLPVFMTSWRHGARAPRNQKQL